MKKGILIASLFPLVLLGTFATPGSEPAQATNDDAGPIKIALVSDSKAVVPGETFTVAIHQELKPGYHTYWRNPGTIGLPTGIEWDLPDGFKAGEIQWPIPQMTKMAAYHVWGYEKEALLLVDITAPKTLSSGGSVTIKGKATWMCCGKQCHPGFEDLSLTLPVGAMPKLDTMWKKPFELVRRQQPRASDAWKITCKATGDSYTLSLSAKKGAIQTVKPGGIRFFDYDRQISSDKPQQLKREGRSYVLKLQQEEHSGEQLKRLRGVLVAEKSWSGDMEFPALSVDIPIVGRKKNR